MKDSQKSTKDATASDVEAIVSSAVVDWVEIGEEDYKAEYKGYNLRLEAMDKDWWWFQVYYSGVPLWHENNFVVSKDEAEQIMLAQIENLVNE